MKDVDLKKLKKIYFVGIGGIGMSAIARFFLLEGKEVSGSDLAFSETTSKLEKLGANITIGQSLENIPLNSNLIIYSAAIPVSEPDLFEEIKNLKIPSISYAEALGEISRGKFTIAISGTHGKTTTTAMLAHILIKAGLNPGVIIGSYMKNPENGEVTNYINGEKYLVTEADDYKENFLSLSPNILVVLNIDEDHLDYYKNIEGVKNGFKKFVSKVSDDGVVITNFGDKNVADVIENGNKTALDYRSIEGAIKLKMPGEHNILNAKAAIMTSVILGVKEKDAVKFLEDFSGAWRRFEYKGKTKRGALVYDDYAHNPQKIEALLSGAREFFPDKKIIVVFQPHLYSRTKDLFKRFSESFRNADEIIFLPIFPAREPFDSTISSDMLAEAVAKKNIGKKVSNLKNFDEAKKYLEDSFDSGDAIFLVGAGDVYKIAEEIVKRKN